MRKVMNMTNTSVQKNWQVGVKSLGGKILAKSCTLREENLHPMVKLGEVKHCLKIMIRVKKWHFATLCKWAKKESICKPSAWTLCAAVRLAGKTWESRDCLLRHLLELLGNFDTKTFWMFHILLLLGILDIYISLGNSHTTWPTTTMLMPQYKTIKDITKTLQRFKKEKNN